MADNKSKILYDAVSKDYNVGTFDEFNQKLQDPQKRQKLYDAIGQDYHLGTFDEFSSKVVQQAQPQTNMQSRFPATDATSKLISGGVSKMGSNPVSGVMDIGVGGAGLIPAMGLDAIGNIPLVGQFAKRGIEGIGSTASNVFWDIPKKAIEQLGGSYGISDKTFGLDNPSQNVKDINESANRLGQFVAPMAVAPFVKGMRQNAKAPAMIERGVVNKMIDPNIVAEQYASKQTPKGNVPFEEKNKIFQREKAVTDFKKGINETFKRDKSSMREVIPDDVQRAMDYNAKIDRGEIRGAKVPIDIQKVNTRFNDVLNNVADPIADALKVTGEIQSNPNISAHTQGSMIAKVAKESIFNQYDPFIQKYGEAPVVYKGVSTTVGELNNAITEINNQKPVQGLYNKATPELANIELTSSQKLASMIDDVDNARSVMFTELERLGVKGIPEARKQYGYVAQFQKMIDNRKAMVENELKLNGLSLSDLHPSKYGLLSAGAKSIIRKITNEDKSFAKSINSLKNVKPKKYVNVSEGNNINSPQTRANWEQARSKTTPTMQPNPMFMPEEFVASRKYQDPNPVNMQNIQQPYFNAASNQQFDMRNLTPQQQQALLQILNQNIRK